MTKWTMSVPVISTAHLPNSKAIEQLSVFNAKYDHGCFCFMDEAIDEPWFMAIREWANDHTTDGWVRFDADADPVPGLTTYDW